MKTTRSILFSTQMVQALMLDRKTQTRRIIKSRHESGLFRVGKRLDGTVTEITSLDYDERPKNGNVNDIRPIASIGDILWVRETWQYSEDLDIPYLYRQQYETEYKKEFHSNIKWKPSIFMPKEAARIFLEVTNIRVEHLQDISEIDAIAEGILVQTDGFECWDYSNNDWGPFGFSPEESYKTLWESINGIDSWKENPWVWVYEFKQVPKPINF